MSLILAVLSVALVQAVPSAESAAITLAKHVIVQEIDRSLPRETFETWLGDVVGARAPMRWETNDCGEQTGGPADRGRDFPMCVEVQADLSNGRQLFVSLAVGVAGKLQADRTPTFWSAVIVAADRTSMTWIKTLAQLPGLVGRSPGA